MNAASIQWAKKYRENLSEGFRGHTFLEIYVEGKWILLDSTSGHYIEDYDFNDPVLHIHKKRGGFFVYQKGLDQWSMGVKGIEDNEKIMKEFALNYPLEKISIKDKEVKRFILTNINALISVSSRRVKRRDGPLLRAKRGNLSFFSEEIATLPLVARHDNVTTFIAFILDL